MSRADYPQGYTHHFGTTNGIGLHYVDEGRGPKVETAGNARFIRERLGHRNHFP
jgi:hypothetical protein